MSLTVKTSFSNSQCRMPCFLCGGQTLKDSVVVEVHENGEWCGDVCNECLRAADPEASLRARANRCRATAECLDELAGRLPAFPSLAEVERLRGYSMDVHGDGDE
jgi:hypothetical protein